MSRELGGRERASGHFASIVWLRGIASLLVVWFHLVVIFCHARGIVWPPMVFIESFINVPLGLRDGFSVYAVDLFFLISGFIVTHAALRETPVSFTVKRLLRIYPSFLFSLLVIAATLWTYTALTGVVFQGLRPPSLDDFLHSIFLLNIYVSDGTRAVTNFNINPVAWTLILEMVFYTSVLLTLPLLKRRPTWVLGVQIAVYAWCVLAFPQSSIQIPVLGWTFLTALFAMGYTIMYLLFLGQAIYLRYTQRIGWLAFALVFGAYYLLYVASLPSIHAATYREHPMLLMNPTLAIVTFVGLLLVDSRLVVPRVARFFGDISYSLYLNHAVVGAVLLATIYPVFGFEIALLAALAASIGLATISYHTVERRSQDLARSLVRRRIIPSRFWSWLGLATTSLRGRRTLAHRPPEPAPSKSSRTLVP